MPDEPGSLERVAAIIKKYGGNINRIQYDRRIDPCTVFYEVTSTEEAYTNITRDLAALGYLQTSLAPKGFLKFSVTLNHTPGALSDFLDLTTRANANIGFIDFDDAGKYPGRLTVSLNLDDPAAIDRLLGQIKSKYLIEIIEYDTTGKKLDDTIFYVRLAQEIRDILGGSNDEFLLSFLSDTNHIAQELMNRGHDPKKAFDCVLDTGRTLRATTGKNFYADVQKIQVTNTVDVYCIQPPCGGSIFVLTDGRNKLMVDTGYGIYHEDILRLFSRYNLGDVSSLSRLVITHADADHCGAGGFFPVPALMHRGTQNIIRTGNRAFGSKNEHSLLEVFYTKMINLFSRFNPPSEIECCPAPGPVTRRIFPVLGVVTIGDIELEILEGLGGHTYGQIYLYSKSAGILFTADAVINFASLTPKRASYNSLADFLVTSVNVDSDLARRERRALLELINETGNISLAGKDRPCLICGGHGTISTLRDGKLARFGEIDYYGNLDPADR
ncbi:MAG: MBL fold metallo-hydrolase [Methanoregula sp.]